MRWRASGWVLHLAFAFAFANLVVRAPAPYQSFASPDGRYHLLVITPWIDGLVPGMPGSGGDKPGTVRLVDGDGRTERESGVALANMVNPTWGNAEVDLGQLEEDGPRVVWPLEPQ